MKIDKITVAITNIDQMVNFYNVVFKCELTPNEAFGTELYSGKLGDLNILLCPNDIAGVKAEQNRQQFDFIVENLTKTIETAQTCGGKLMGEINVSEQEKAVGVKDPDGNSIVFIEKL